MRTPMPSPRGTNHAGLFVNTSPRAAYDAKLDEGAGVRLLEFLRDKLSPEDLAAFSKMAGLDPDEAMDSPEPFSGMPRTNEQAQDQARARLGVRVARLPAAATESFAKRFPHASRIRVE